MSKINNVYSFKNIICWFKVLLFKILHEMMRLYFSDVAALARPRLDEENRKVTDVEDIQIHLYDLASYAPLLHPWLRSF